MSFSSTLHSEGHLQHIAVTYLQNECFPAVQGPLYYSVIVLRPLLLAQPLMWHFLPVKLSLNPNN